MHTIYDQLRAKEKEFKDGDASKDYQIKGPHLTLKKKAESLLDRPEYRNNNLVQKLKNSRLGKIVDDVTLMRKYKFKFPWNKKERQKYNSQVEELSQIISDSENLKIGSIFNAEKEPEFVIPYCFAGGSAIVGSIGLLINLLSPEGNTLDLHNLALVGGYVASVLGGTIKIGEQIVRRAIPRIQAEYIDDVLSGKLK